MTAYNFFFQNERKRILEHGLEAYNAMMDGKKDLPPPVASSSHEMKPSTSSSSKHKVSFQELGKAIGRRWRDIPKKDLERYQVLAKEESPRYRREIKIYNDAEEKRRKDFARKLYSKPDPDDKASDDSFNSRSSGNEAPSINAGVASIARQHGMAPEDLIKLLGSQLLQLRQQPTLPVAGLQPQQQGLTLSGLLGGQQQQQQSAQSVSLQAQQIILAQSEQIRMLQEQVNFLLSQQGGNGNNGSNHGATMNTAASQPGLNGGLSLSHAMNLPNSNNGVAPLPTSIITSNVGSESSRSAVTSDQSYSAGSSSPTNTNNDPLSQLQAQLNLLQAQTGVQQQQQAAMPGANGTGGINVNAMLGLAPTAANGPNLTSTRPLLREATSSLSDGSAGASDAAVGSASSTSSGGGARETEPQLPGWNLSVLQALAGNQNGLNK